MSDLVALEKELRGLMRGKHSSLTLSFNEENAPNYMTVKEFDDIDKWCGDWVSDEERQNAIETNSVWCLHWYPDTPVGFCAILASSLPALFDALRAEQEPSP